jgi:hypothetical protein
VPKNLLNKPRVVLIALAAPLDVLRHQRSKRCVIAGGGGGVNQVRHTVFANGSAAFGNRLTLRQARRAGSD